MGVTPAESRIMAALWAGGPLSLDEIVRQVAEPQAWGEATVKTLIQRLMKRGAVRSERRDGCTRYVALLQEADYLEDESQSLLDRLFGGSLTPLVAHFVKRRKLSPDDIARLKQLIAEVEDDR